VQVKFLRFITPVLGAGKAEQIIGLCSEAIASGHFAPLVGEIEQSTNHFGKNASV
jgi:hypothetical protein